MPEEITLHDYHDLFVQLRDVLELAEVRGDICEFGCYAGRTTEKLAQMFPYSHIHAFDTFEGMPGEDWQDGERDLPGSFTPPEGTLARIRRHKNIVIHQGRFVDTLAGWPDEDEPRVMLAYVDADLVVSTQQALDWLAPRMLHHGVVLVDDYGDLQAMTAVVDAWVAQHHADLASFESGAAVVVWEGTNGQTS